jgi:hypothetical protein
LAINLSRIIYACEMAKEDLEPVVASSHELAPAEKQRGRSNADAALELLNNTGGLQQPIDPARQRRLLRKIDLHIMPLICLVYFLQYIDKTSLSYASVTGLRESAHLHGNQFNWVASIFFFGQLTFEFPTIRLLQVFPLAKYVSVNVVIWGGVLAALAGCKSYGSLLACRFFLGAAEAAVVPAWVVRILSLLAIGLQNVLGRALH